MLEMPQFEGRVVAFENIKSCRIRVYTGDTNVISGGLVFQEIPDDRHQRKTTRRNWQIRRRSEEPSQYYIIVPTQKRLESPTKRTGHLRGFWPTLFQESTTITQQLEEQVMFSALRFDITPFNTNAKSWLHNMGTHSTVRTQTPGDPIQIHFQALSNIKQRFHLLKWIGKDIDHDCAQEANLYAGATRLNLSRENRLRP
jgi:hypothetical protein